MLRLRLQRRGKRGYATYRIVVAERGAPTQGRFLKDVGYYNPHRDEFNVQPQEVKRWLQQGVQPTATVHNLLVTHGIITAAKVRSWRPKAKPALSPTEAPAPPTDHGDAGTEAAKEAPPEAGPDS